MTCVLLYVIDASNNGNLNLDAKQRAEADASEPLPPHPATAKLVRFVLSILSRSFAVQVTDTAEEEPEVYRIKGRTRFDLSNRYLSRLGLSMPESVAYKTKVTRAVLIFFVFFVFFVSASILCLPN